MRSRTETGCSGPAMPGRDIEPTRWWDNIKVRIEDQEGWTMQRKATGLRYMPMEKPGAFS